MIALRVTYATIQKQLVLYYDYGLRTYSPNTGRQTVRAVAETEQWPGRPIARPDYEF